MTNSQQDCLSMLELVEAAESRSLHPADREHLQRCGRCRALMRQIPGAPGIDFNPQDRELWSRKHGVPPDPDEKRSGQLWVVRVDDDWSEVVALVGRTPDSAENFIVAPVAGNPSLATERDLILDPERLGYQCFVDVSNAGVITEAALDAYRGHLGDAEKKDLILLYRAMMGADVSLDQQRTGVPVVDSSDPRLAASILRAERFDVLWREAFRGVDRSVDDGPDAATLSLFLSRFLEEPAWDRATLLEASAVEGASLDRFLADELDLTDARDIPDLAGVLYALNAKPADALPAVEATLHLGSGGIRHAATTYDRIAARSRKGKTAEQVTGDLLRSSSEVDDSAEARGKQIAAYLEELGRALDELS